MSSDASEDLVRRFVARINARDVDGMVALMTDDHRFVDSLGSAIVGRERMRLAWEQYFRIVPDYGIEVRETFGHGQIIVLLGMAHGTYSPDGTLRTENAWETPAAWRALVRDNHVAEWQVHADIEPLRQRMRAAAGGSRQR
jgi:ketosteroid isomerase-like protein